MQTVTLYIHALSLMGVLSCCPAMAQDKAQDRNAPHPKLTAAADRLVERFMTDHRVPGLVLAVVRNGQIVLEKGYGVRSPDDDRQPDAETLFYIGSLSKAVTAVGIELLADRGKLKLDESIGLHIKGLPKAWQHIPLSYVLAHQSGIPDLPAKKPTFEEMLRSADDLPLAFQPGAKQQYNNFNFALAGKAIEGASGKPYLEFMTEEVFEPLGMMRTGFGRTDKNASPGHHIRKNGKLEAVNEVVPRGGEYGIPSGFLQTTLTDLLRLYRGIEGHKLLSAKRTKEMISPVSAKMTGTPGWFAHEVGGATIVAKNGAAAGYSSQFQFVPGKGHAVIFIMNLQTEDLGTGSLAHDLLREICGLQVGDK